MIMVLLKAFLCLPFWSLLSILALSKEDESRNQEDPALFVHILNREGGVYIFNKDLLLFAEHLIVIVLVWGGNITLCQWNSSPSLPLRFGLLIAVISSVSLLISSAFRWWDLNCQYGELAKDLPSPPPFQPKLLFPSPPSFMADHLFNRTCWWDKMLLRSVLGLKWPGTVPLGCDQMATGSLDLGMAEWSCG